MIGELLSLGCALVWGISVVLFKRSEEVSPQGINIFKNLVGALLLGATLAVMGEQLPRERPLEDWARLALSGVLGIAVADTMFLASLRRLGAALIAIIDCIYAPLVVLFSVVFLGEHLSTSFLLGAFLVVAGLFAATVSPGAVRGAAANARADLGGLALAVGSVILMALAVVLAKPVLAHSSVVEVTFTRMAAGTLALTLWLVRSRASRAAFGVFRPQAVWRQLMPASVLGTYVSMLLWLGGMKYTSAATASLLNQLSVVFTLLLAWTLLREPLSGRRLVGSGLSIAGAIIVLLGTSVG